MVEQQKRGLSRFSNVATFQGLYTKQCLAQQKGLDLKGEEEGRNGDQQGISLTL